MLHANFLYKIPLILMAECFGAMKWSVSEQPLNDSMLKLATTVSDWVAAVKCHAKLQIMKSPKKSH